jgi:hypothetical protein
VTQGRGKKKPGENLGSNLLVYLQLRRKERLILPMPPAEMEKPTEWKGFQLFRIRT